MGLFHKKTEQTFVDPALIERLKKYVEQQIAGEKKKEE